MNKYTCTCVPGFEGKNCTISKFLNNFNNLINVFFNLSVRDSKYCFHCVTSVVVVVVVFFFFHLSVNGGVFKVK